ncbi:hypothetical protein KUTeg_008322 [Tegillarca granosa]|uniref:Uncharacterized protein n=1 Tax=Tegillarca granosa TaxID=220873 RepID=A0ABQ9F8U9_TEGGR|nr:hypothetical protein KUTeg_008322 [Tegillarca granosa]
MAPIFHVPGEMDGDSNDGTATESLNGETKPDVAKLAQTAIIKQDVMLSATSTQSPLATVSSVFTMPTISMPTVSMANSAGLGSLADHLFMPHVPSVNDPPSSHGHGSADSKSDTNGAITSLSSPSQLFGQPQVAAPQFFLTGQSLQAAAAAGQAGTPSLPVQQLLIPVSTGNGTQQFISIPVSLATGGNQQIQLLTTSNGQIIATNLASIPGLTQPLAQPLNLNINSGTQGSTNNSNHTNQSSTHNLASQISALTQVLTSGAQNQVLALGPQVLNPLSLTQAATSVSTSQQSSATHNNISHNSTNHSNHGNNLTASLQSSLQSSLRHAHSNQSSSSPVQPTPPTQSTPRLPVQSLTDGLPPNVSQLLPSK